MYGDVVRKYVTAGGGLPRGEVEVAVTRGNEWFPASSIQSSPMPFLTETTTFPEAPFLGKMKIHVVKDER